MNENNRKKREWVKTAAIVFLSVMLILTFFSQTIMNYSLPEVATQYVASGTITAKIRGSGMIESGDPYEVKVTQSRKVASVEVRVGDVVEKGTVLAYLEDADSEELKAALEALEAARNELEDKQDAYNEALLKGEISASDINAASGGVSTNSYRRQITDYQNAIEALENEIKPLKDKIAELEVAIKDFDAQTSLEQGLDKAAEERVTATKAALDNALNHFDSVSNGDAAQKAEAKTRLDNAQKAYDDAVKAKADRDASTIYANLADQKVAKEIEKYNTQKALDEKTAEKEKLEEDLTKLLGNISNAISLDGLLDDIRDAREKVDKAQAAVDEQTAKDIGATITAPISGTINTVNIKSGNNTSPDTPVVVMQPEGKGYTLSFSVTNEQARRLSVGDQAELVNSWRYDDIKVTLANIKPDTQDPGQKKLLTFNVEGDVAPGQTLNLSVGQKSSNYDLIVPNSAIREDNNGKFILIVESKSTPLGTRYTATRVDVEVLASDDTQSAVNGALYGYEFVITTSTKPVEAGKLVRLADN